MKFRVFWDALPCIQVDVVRRFKGVYCLHQQGDECDPKGYKSLNATYSSLPDLICEISGSHGDEYEVYSLLGCTAM
jgi:hypothetical protein